MGPKIVDIDSGERDLTLYPLPNDYTVTMNLPLYRVSKVRLMNARLVNCQQLINPGNRQFELDGTTIVLPKGTYANGAALATGLQTALIGTNVTIVTFNSYSNTLTYSNIGTGNNFTFKFFTGSNGYSTSSTVGPPANILGFTGLDASSTNGTLTSNCIDLAGPTALLLRLTCGSEDLIQSSYIDGGTFSFGKNTYDTSSCGQLLPTYMGRIPLNSIGSVFQYTPQDSYIEYATPPDLNITSMRIRMYWNNGTKLIPYDFGVTNHMLKFEFTCETDRFLNVQPYAEVDELPEPIKEPEGPPNNMMIYIIVSVVLFLGFLMLIG